MLLEMNERKKRYLTGLLLFLGLFLVLALPTCHLVEDVMETSIPIRFKVVTMVVFGLFGLFAGWALKHQKHL